MQVVLEERGLKGLTAKEGVVGLQAVVAVTIAAAAAAGVPPEEVEEGKV